MKFIIIILKKKTNYILPEKKDCNFVHIHSVPSIGITKICNKSKTITKYIHQNIKEIYFFFFTEHYKISFIYTITISHTFAVLKYIWNKYKTQKRINYMSIIVYILYPKMQNEYSLSVTKTLKKSYKEFSSLLRITVEYAIQCYPCFPINQY